MNRRKSLIPLVLALSVCLLFLTSCANDDVSGGKTTAEPTEIVLIDRDGEEKTVDLSKLESITGDSGFIKSTGTIVGPASFTGPKLSDVLAEIGGITQDNSLIVTAGDGYEMTLTYEQAMGNVMTYDSEGEPKKVGGLDTVLALESSADEVLEKAPRLCYLGDGEILTDGHFWIKEVAKIKVVPAVEDWELSLSGIEEASMDRSTFESVATCGRSTHPGQEFEDTNKKGEKAVYKGVPLWVMVSVVDGADDEDGHYRFNRDLSQTGYTVQVIAVDGYKVELSSKDVAYNDGIFLAYLKDDQPLDKDSGPLQLTGPKLPSKQHSVKQVAEIKLVNLP